MSRAVEELSQIPFAHLIGSPMKAAIEAQALAAQTTVEFIQKVGFKQPAAGAPDVLFTKPDQDADAGQSATSLSRTRSSTRTKPSRTFP